MEKRKKKRFTIPEMKAEVHQYYPNAKAIKVGNGKEVQIWSDVSYLGKGQNSRCAWLSAMRNL